MHARSTRDTHVSYALDRRYAGVGALDAYREFGMEFGTLARVKLCDPPHACTLEMDRRDPPGSSSAIASSLGVKKYRG